MSGAQDEPHDFATFVLISAALVATPGPSTVFLVNNAIIDGPRRAIVALSCDLAANTVLFPPFVLRAIYILWLGVRYLRSLDIAAGGDSREVAMAPDEVVTAPDAEISWVRHYLVV